MNSKMSIRFSLLILMTSAALTAFADQVDRQNWVTMGKDDKLVYRTTPRGDRVLDFSYAGYMGGGVKLPHAPVGATLSPGTSGDDTDRIQKALDELGARASAQNPQALLLLPGEYRCSSALNLAHSGVVLRGGGSGAQGTVIKMAGQPHAAFSLGDKGSPSTGDGNPIAMTDAYIPSGATRFSVSDAGGLKVGDTIVISRPITQSWVSFMGMDKLVQDGKPQVWLKPGPKSAITCERRIVAIQDKKITVDIPLTDNYDSAYLNPPGPSLRVQSLARRISQIGLEHLSVIAPPPASLVVGTPQFAGIFSENVEDAWVRDVHFSNQENCITTTLLSRRMTFQQCAISHEIEPGPRGPKFADINGSGSQLLFYQCQVQGDYRFPYTSSSRVTGPNVVLDFKVAGKSIIEPHMRWATGLLLDNCQVPDGGISLINRKTAGSGHGWTIGWSVVWNCQAKNLDIQQPPGSINWSMGSHQGSATDGAQSSPVQPTSLYRAQLAERLGAAAVASLDAE